MDRRQLGACYEQAVAIYLSKIGYQILCMNYTCYFGEIDIIAKEGDELVFIEVKYRSSRSYGDPAEAVTKRKQQKIYLCANHYMKAHRLVDIPCRFDVVAVCKEQIRIIRNAFGGL
ncbi:protein of unknown function UPF0102 [Lachnospiraceae bacterium TWA4]|nr:protein of unknown function UPF0102 [Lachnospiraceae bacterium TWA4]